MLAQQACEPGVSVSQLAQQHDINVNMLFKWRRHLLAGLFDASTQAPVMLPVTIVTTPTMEVSAAQAAAKTLSDSGPTQQGIIEIQFAQASIRFDGHADLATLRAVVRMLRS